MKSLIVDDEKLTRVLLEKILAAHGHVETAGGGREAVEKFKAAAEGNDSFELITLDINMPGIDGHQVLAEIRRIEAENGVDDDHSVKVIMISAESDRSVIRKSFRENCEAYIIKPVTDEKVRMSLEGLGLIQDTD